MANAMRRIISLVLAFLLVFNPMAAAAGGIVVDPKAPAGNQPRLNAAPNGVPMVDVARPNAKGLSHNMFDQFNVGKPGVIMNNSNKLGRTQLGGVVANNPNLAGGAEARVILNEVTGGSRSQLEGYTEIFGYPADYILANPNGITVNGGGFINTPKATLTTGKPHLDETGVLKSFDVRKGEVFIDGLGLNVANLDAFDIISRTAKINADIHAKKLGITTGYGSHDPVTGLFSALPADGSSAPLVALDSTALGGMYADRIILVGNEKGVGVNLEGITRATDDLVLTADGKIRIKGAVSSDKGLSVSSAQDSVEVAGSLAAATVADVKAAKSLKLQSDTAGKGLLYGADVNISAGSLNNVDGRIEAGKSLAVNSATDVINAGVIRSGSIVALNAGGAVRNTGQVEAENRLTVDARTVLENSGRLISIGAVKIHSSGGIANSGGEILSKEEMILKSAGSIANSGTLRTESQAKISALNLTNTDGSILAKDSMALDAAGKIVNTGTIGTDRDASISAENLANTGGSILAQGDLELAVQGSLSNSGMLYSGAFSRIRAKVMRNDPAGQVLALNSLNLETDADLENLGIMSAGEALSMRIGGSLLNTGGSILAQTGLDLATLGDITNSGSMQSGGAGSYQSGGILFNSGDIVSKGDLELSMAGDLSNSGSIASDADVDFSIGGSLINSIDGQMQAAAAAVFDVTGDLSNSGLMRFTGMGSFRVGGGLFNTGGAILSQTALDFDVQGVTENTGTLHSGDLLSLHSSSVDNSGQILAAGMSAFDVTGELRNSGRMEFSGPGSLSVGGGLFNTGGDILSQTALDFNVLGAMDNTGTLQSGDLLSSRSVSLGNSGRILAGGRSLFDVTGDLRNSGRMELVGIGSFSLGSGLFNTGGILSQTALDFDVLGAVDNTGTLYSGNLLSLSSDSLDNSGQILAAGASLFDVTDDLRNSGRIQFIGMSSFSVGGGLFNTGGDILSQSALDFDVQGALQNTGILHSGNRLALRSASVDNSGQILAAGASLFDVTGDLRNSGRMEFNGEGSFSVGSGLFNTGGDILSQTALDFDVLGALDNTGTLYSGDLLSLRSASLDNSGQILAAGASLFDVTGDLRNSGRMEFTGEGAFNVGGGLFNTGGNILSQTALDFDVQGAMQNTGTMHSGDLLSLRSARLDNSGQILAQGDSAIAVQGDLINSNFLFSGGVSKFSVGGVLQNLRGQILSLGDMVLEGLSAGSRMLKLQNDSGTIETLEGSMSIRAKVVRNTNLDFVLTPGTEVVSRKAGIYSFFSDNWDQAQDLYKTLSGSSEVTSTRNALIITPVELTILGFGLDRNVFVRSELDEAIAIAEKRFAAIGGTPEEVAAVANLKSRLVDKGIYVAVQHYKDRSKVAAYLESIIRDKAAGMESGANIAAAVDMNIEADSFRNYVSRVSTATGDISIATDSFENAGEDIYEHRTIQWTRGHANEHNSPRLAVEGTGVEVVKTSIGHAYGSISAGGKVFISADHVNNGILENTGVASSVNGKVSYKGEIGPQGGIAPQSGIEPQGDIGPQGDVGPQNDIGPQGVITAPPRPGAQVLGIRNIDALIGSLPKDGLFSVNKTPGHRYLIETNPALTSMALFYGSDYFLGQTGIDLSRTHQQLLGDAFYESRLVREQVFALTGRRYLSASVASDGDQMLALMDNAIAARKDLNLSVGVALTAEQIAALSSDIVWLETRVVDGHEVLVPIVYLCRTSLDTIAQGGSVIIGRDVEIRTTGDTVNRGVIKASRDLSINADNVFNTFGIIQGDTVTLAAVDSIFNTSGKIKGRDVSLDAGQDIISRTAKTTFSAEETLRRAFSNKGFGIVGRDGAPVFFGTTSTTRTTSETVGQRASIEATGDLSMRAGRDIGITGSDVKAGGDATLSAGRNVVIAAQNLESHSSGKTGKSKSSFDTQTSKVATVEAGGSVHISAGQDVTIQGSEVSAGANVNIGADRNISVISDVEGYEYRFKQKSSGGTFGTSRSELREASIMSNAPSTITAGGDVNMEAGKGGGGDLAVVGSRVEASADMNLRARDGILVSSAQESESMISASSESKLFSGKSKASGDAQVTQVGSEIIAGNDLHAEAKNVAVSASQIHAGNDVVIKSTESDVIVSGAQNTVSAYRYEEKDGWNLSAPLELPLAILVGGGVEFYSSKMKEAKDTASFNFGSLITAGNNVEVDSARDAVVIGSTVAAGNDVNIKAVRDTNLIPGLTAQTSERRTKEKSIGVSPLSISENEIKSFSGVTKKETGSKFTGDYNAGSVVSAGNDVKIEAGNNVNQFSSGIEAGRDVTLKSGNDINVDANKDVEHMEQYARQIQIGVTASARQSVTTAARTLADTPKNMASGEGSDAAKGITTASSILRGVSAAQQLTNVSASASITAGASVSQSSSSMDAADAVSSSIRAGRDAELDAKRDVKIAGAAVQAEEDVSIQAGRDVEIKSATNNYSAGAESSSASAGVGVGASYSAKGGAAAGIRVQAEAAGSKNTSRAQTHTNSAVAAGETLSVKSGSDTTVAGANLEGKKVAMDVGGDLVVKSEQDKRAATGSNWNAGGSATFGYGFSADAHVGMGKSKADSAWVNKQTSIIGQEQVDIRTEQNTHVEGAVIAAKNGNLKLDTGTLTHKDIEDHDKSKNFQISLSGSYSTSGGDQKDANGDSDSSSGTLDAGYSSGDRRQINRATIGDGEIIIRSDPTQGLEGLNRDLRKAQEITKDESTSVTVYVDSSAIQEVASGFEGIRSNLENLAELVKKALPDDQRLKDSVDNQLSIRGKLIEKGMTDEQADAVLEKYALYADLIGEISKLVDAKGGWDNLTEAEAQAFIDSLLRDSRFVTLLASSDNSDSLAITIDIGQFVVGAVTGGLQAAGSDAMSVLFLLNDMSGYMFYCASGGLLFQEQASNYTNTVQDLTNGVVYLVQNSDQIGPAIVDGLEKKWNDFLAAVEGGDYYLAGKLYGEFYYQICMLAIAGEGVAKSVRNELKSVAPKFAATMETAEAAGVASKSTGRNLPFKDADRIIEVNKTLDRIESGASFPYKKDGIIFKNNEGILPEGNYREYTVETPGLSNRGTRRIIQDTDTGKTYYTDDHYRNFIQIDPTKR